MAETRLQKYLAQAGLCSRRHAEDIIRAGRVSVNGRVQREMGVKVDPLTDRVTVDGAPVRPEEEMWYIALHKPAGVVSSCMHPGKYTVLDMVDAPVRVYPVGRLDVDSTGLLLLTNDGRIHHRLSHPSFDHEKEYVVEVEWPIQDQELERLRRGVMVLGRMSREARVRRLGPDRFTMVLKEGRNRQIRRMVEEVGNKVARLHRVRVACVRLGDLPEGKWRRLTPEEEKGLLAATRGE
jgi:23S rRNA pseudouridine2605 synthase/23S rRNA pseudouridine2604 synthase